MILKLCIRGLILLIVFSAFFIHYGFDKNHGFSELDEKVVWVSEPGVYADSGVVYRLANDIRSDGSAIFLGKDVVLDLNGYTIYYADGGYSHVWNGGFELGVEGWDLSNARGAKVLSTKGSRPFVGDYILSLVEGDEILSSYVNLPIANRSYYAMCAVSGRYYEDLGMEGDGDMQLSLFVEDEFGNEVLCYIQYADSLMLSSPIRRRGARLGGGYVVAHLQGLPAGKYRVKVRAETDCLIDEVDIVPAFDVGVGVVGEIKSLGHNDHMYKGLYGAFFDLNRDSVSRISLVEGDGRVTIKNGFIECSVSGAMMAGVMSTAFGVHVVLEDVKIKTKGVNSVAVDVQSGDIKSCVFDVENPFVINRHGYQFYAVNVRGDRKSIVTNSKFYGGQGCLNLKGVGSIVQGNLFVNKQTVTNHYSLSVGDSSLVFNNVITPKYGSGISLYRRKGVQIYDNLFRIEASPPTCEYYKDYSSNGVRISDYGSERGASNGAIGNRIFNNKFEVIGASFPEYPNYVPLVSAVFYSASAGENYVYGNEVFVVKKDLLSKTEAYAFYIGNAKYGKIFANKISTNVTPIWVGNRYEGASNIDLLENHIINISKDSVLFAPFRLGYLRSSKSASNIMFRSNTYDGLAFHVAEEGGGLISYSVSWRLSILLDAVDGGSYHDKRVEVFDVLGRKVYEGGVSRFGRCDLYLTSYTVHNRVRQDFGPFSIVVNGVNYTVELNSDTAVRVGVK